MLTVQIFGMKNSQATRAARAIFQRAACGRSFCRPEAEADGASQIRRFAERFGLPALVDRDGNAWVDAGLKYLKLSESELLGRIEKDPGTAQAAHGPCRQPAQRRS